MPKFISVVGLPEYNDMEKNIPILGAREGRCFSLPKNHPSGADVVFDLPGHKQSFYKFINEVDAYLSHREDGPAACYYEDGDTVYCYMGKWHSYSTPARNFSPDIREWYIHGEHVNENEYLNWIDEMGIDLQNLSPEDKTLIDMRWKKS